VGGGAGTGLRERALPKEVGLIAREIWDLPCEVIEERFVLRPGEGVLSLFAGLIRGPNGGKGVYFTELYTNRDSLSMTTEAPLDVLEACGVPLYDVMAQREQHPYIARLLEGAVLREYQAHMLPRDGIDDPRQLYGSGVLLAGDAGKFMTSGGAGSWPAMASGVAAARTVKRACEKGDFSRQSLAAYLEFLDEEGLLEVQRQARRTWDYRREYRDILDEYPERFFHIAKRYFSDWETEQKTYERSFWGDIYHELVKPVAPRYVRWPMNLAVWINTRRWQRRQRQGQ